MQSVNWTEVLIALITTVGSVVSVVAAKQSRGHACVAQVAAKKAVDSLKPEYDSEDPPRFPFPPKRGF